MRRIPSKLIFLVHDVSQRLSEQRSSSGGEGIVADVNGVLYSAEV